MGRLARASLILICLGTLFLNGCHRSKAISSDKPKIADGVIMQDVTFSSTSLGRQMTYRVFWPQRVEPRERLRVVYLLHGGGGNYKDWSTSSNVSQYALKGLILVMPQGDTSYYVNAHWDSSDRYEDYITKDLIADVESRFPVFRDRNHRAIIGVSMGGFAAIHYALKLPELYVFAGALSPAIDVPSRRFSVKYFWQSWRFQRIFGPTGSVDRTKNDPFVQVNSADPRVTPYIYLTAGEQEPLAGPIQRFAGRLLQNNFDYEFHLKPGGHDWSEWNTQIPDCFASLFSHLELQTADLQHA